MPDRPAIGEEVVHEVTVTPEMTARLFDRDVHPVYATAWMVRHVEEAGRLLVEPHLGPDEDATGYRIELTHERPARVGELITVRARVTEVDRRSCSVAFEVFGQTGLVGRGIFVQWYVKRHRSVEPLDALDSDTQNPTTELRE
jgi:fluoroacetyl-CoA thioesterase